MAMQCFMLSHQILSLGAGHVVFHGPREEVLPFFSGLGFQLPERKGIADFLQEVTSKKDQRVSTGFPWPSECNEIAQCLAWS
jgi:hypothetical protein